MSVKHLSDKLARLRSDIRRVVLVIGLLRVFLVTGGVLAASFLLDWFGRLSPSTRITLLAAGTIIILAAIFQYIVRPLRVKLTDDALALLVEKRFPEFKDRLISAVQLARRLNAAGESDFSSPHLVGRIVEEAVEEANVRPFRQVLRMSPLKRLAAAGLLALAAAGAYTATHEDIVRIWVTRMTQPHSGVEWPRQTTITLPDYDSATPIYLAKGESLTIDALCEGRIPSRVTVHYTFNSGASRSRRMQNISGGSFRALFPQITENMKFHVSGGDHETGRYIVRVIERPRVDTILVSYEFPAYTRLSGYPQTAGLGDVTGVVGTKVNIVALSNKPLREAKIVFDNGDTIPLEIADDDEERSAGGSRISGEFVLKPGPTSYRIEVADLGGLTDTSPVTYRLRAIIDNPPVIRVITPRGNREITANATISVTSVSTDERDFGGIRETRFVMRKGEDGPVVSNPFADTTPGESRVENNGSWEVSKLTPQEGQVITAYVEAEDYNDITGPGIGRSEPFYLSVVSPAQLAAKLDQRLDSVKRDLTTIQRVEEDLKAETDRLADESADELDAENLTSLRRVFEQQKGLAEQTKNAGRQLQDIANEMLDNKIGTTDDAERLEAYRDALQTLADEKMAGAAAKLEEAHKGREQTANLRQASATQREIIDELGALLRQLSRTEDLDELIRQAGRLVLRQKGINDRTRAVSVRTLGQKPEEMDEEDRAVFRAIQRDQMSSQEEMRNLESGMTNFIQNARDKDPAAADAVQHAMQHAADDRIRQNMQQIADTLEQMSSAAAVPLQNHVYDSLQRLLQNLNDAKRKQYADTEQLRREMEETARKLDELIQRQEEHKAASDPDRLAAIEEARQTLQNMIEAQKNLRADADQRAANEADSNDLADAQQFLAQQMQALADQTRELSGLNVSEELDGAAEDMQQAQQHLDGNQPREATHAQADALEKMQAALDELEAAAQAAQPDKLAEEQKELQREAENLAADMQALAQQAQNVDARTAERMQGAAESSSQAGEHMQQAGEQLEQNQKHDAQQEQQEALDKLAEASEQLQKAQDALAEKEREKMLFEIGQALAKMLTRQREVNTRTIEIDETVRLEGELTRKLRLMLQEISAVQRMLKEEADNVREKLEQENSAVFLFAMTQVASDMKEAEGRLTDEDAGWTTQQLHRDIEQTLTELVNALRQEYDRAREGGGGGGGAGGGQMGAKPPLVPPLAELKMLRTLQTNIFDTTREYEEEKALGRLSEVLLQRRIQRLGERQEHVSRTARKLAEELEKQREEQER